MFEIPQNRDMQEFHELCTQYNLEAKITALPNPQDLGMLRVIEFQNYCDDSIKVILESGNFIIIPAKGTGQIMLHAREVLPTFERIE